MSLQLLPFPQLITASSISLYKTPKRLYILALLDNILRMIMLAVLLAHWGYRELLKEYKSQRACGGDERKEQVAGRCIVSLLLLISNAEYGKEWECDW